mgnify:CR=1 FL=1
MKRKTILTLSAAATAAVIGALAIPAIAGGWGPGGGMMQRMQERSGDEMRGRYEQAMRGHGGPDMRLQRRGQGPMGMRDWTENPVYQSFDTDADGSVSNAELEAGLAALHAAHDADGNGALSAEEFGELFSLVTASMAERPFTMLDADENGEIDAEELAFPAQMMARMRLMQVNDRAAPAE